MYHDVFANYRIEDNQLEAFAKGREPYGDIQNLYTRIKLLSQFLGRSSKDKAKNEYKGLIHSREGQSLYVKVIEEGLNKLRELNLFCPQPKEINILPPLSWFLSFQFSLAKPFLSKDDDEFYPCDNPLRKEKVFKVPMISSSTWKGILRWVMRLERSCIGKNDDEVIIRLFGHEKGEEVLENFRKGRLCFYPTFFDQMTLEVINPHDRETRTGTLPIYIESVPIGAQGTFSLLYIPFDLIGRDRDEANTQAKKDMEETLKAIKAMMLTYGFSAKKTSGFGLADEVFGPEKGIFQAKEMEDPLELKYFSDFEKITSIVDKVWS